MSRGNGVVNYAYETPYPIEVVRLLITGSPRTVVLYFTVDGRESALRLNNPQPLESVVQRFDECYQIRIVDSHSAGSQLEFGRYQVEIWDEDNPISEFRVDAFKLENGSGNISP
ncbi:MAG: hypothetical protein DWQ34_14305 [Planctomycetota bacterium]|nr:MAG: hypothetical protein DWQ34_14305 [Planctomycetota bacterium]REK20017.1 MAG: hypothetical protein DWQ41_27250 [Planctomycetota bacterium]REK27584.1 MAG: hypothetical protein DWQ45_26270 [Planctomycetota bacterium]